MLNYLIGIRHFLSVLDNAEIFSVLIGDDYLLFSFEDFFDVGQVERESYLETLSFFNKVFLHVNKIDSESFELLRFFLLKWEKPHFAVSSSWA